MPCPLLRRCSVSVPAAVLECPPGRASLVSVAMTTPHPWLRLMAGCGLAAHAHVHWKLASGFAPIWASASPTESRSAFPPEAV
jgi:hypothetical protein